MESIIKTNGWATPHFPGLREARISRKMTQKEVAEKAGVDKRLIRQIESGKPLPPRKIVEKITSVMVECDIRDDRRFKLAVDLIRGIREEVSLTEAIFSIEIIEAFLKECKNDMLSELKQMY